MAVNRTSRMWFSIAVVLLMFSILLGYAVAGIHRGSERVSNRLSTMTPLYPSAAVFSTALRNGHAPQKVFGQRIDGLVVNHHLLAADFMVDTLIYARRPGIDRIIILAPNHFFIGHGKIISTTGLYATPFGQVAIDDKFVRGLAQSGTVSIDGTPFLTEHGIFNLLPFIKKLYPDVPIVPIITKDGTPDAAVDALSVQLAKLITPQTLVIASLDFAHLQTNTGAERLDANSLQRLRRLKTSTVDINTDGEIQVDSPATLRLFLSLMRSRGATAFTLLRHSNSALETGHLQATDVTSHITGLFSRFPIVVH